jgi:hypothetical protein
MKYKKTNRRNKNSKEYTKKEKKEAKTIMNENITISISILQCAFKKKIV